MGRPEAMILSADDIASEIANLRSLEKADIEEHKKRLALQKARHLEMREYTKKIGLDKTSLRLFFFLDSVFLAPDRQREIARLIKVSQSEKLRQQLQKERLTAIFADIGIYLIESEERKIKSGDTFKNITLGQANSSYKLTFRHKENYGEKWNDYSVYGSGQFEIFFGRKQCFGMAVSMNGDLRHSSWTMTDVYLLKVDEWSLNIAKWEQLLSKAFSAAE